MRFEQEFIDKVREANNLADIVSQYTELKGRGAQKTGLCPFPDHNEKTGSFSVSEDKQLYYCFGCKKSGNIFNFVQALMGLNFPESVEFLAQRAHISLPENPGQKLDQGEKSRRKLMKRVNAFAARFYHRQLKALSSSHPARQRFYHRQLKALSSSHPARQYCQSRGLSEELIDRFEIGYAPEAWESLVRALTEQKVPLEIADRLGLVRPRKNDKGFYDMLRHRLVFPIKSRTGESIGFGGRVLSSDQQPKYLNSPESDIFSKGRVFYGLDETAKFIRTADVAVVVEGYMDFLALYSAGVTNVVATLGTALTREHARVLKMYSPNVVILFDGDAAGQQAAHRSLPVLLAEGLRPRSLSLPAGQDPDDFLKTQGVKELVQRLHEAPELFTTVLDGHLRGYRGRSVEKLRVLDQMGPYLQAIQDRRLLDLYLQDLADRIAQPLDWVTKQVISEPKMGLQKAPKRPPVTPSGPSTVIETETAIQLSGAPARELDLLNLILLDEEHFKALTETEIHLKMTHDGVREAWLLAGQVYRQMPNEFDKLTASLLDRVQPAQALAAPMKEELAQLNREGLAKMIKDCSDRIEQAYQRRKIRAGISELRGLDPRQDGEKLEQIMKEIKLKHDQRRRQER